MPQSSEPAKGKYDKPSKQKQNFQNHHVNHDSAFDSGDHRCYGGCVFAWFSNADKVTVTEITMSTAESYKIDFNLQKTRGCGTICSTSVRPLFATAERMPAN